MTTTNHSTNHGKPGQVDIVWLWLVLFSCLAGGLGAVYFGFRPDWDLLNYHLYNPHALISGRNAIDVAPAQMQSYLNPALYVPVYLVFRFSHPLVLVVIIGMIQALQLVLLIRILEELTGQCLRHNWVLLIVAGLGCLGPVFLNQLGGTQGDTLLSTLVLSALLVLLLEYRQPMHTRSLKSGLLAGLLLGMACGFKLTMAIYALGLGLASLLYFGGDKRWRIVSGLVIGGTLGVLIISGAWFIHQWQVWGNPLFPNFNNILASPWIDQSSYRDLRFIPKTTLEWLFYPAYWLMDPHRVWEHSFRDIRVPLLIVIVFALPLFAWSRMRKAAPALGLVWLFLAFSYLLWIYLFSIYRYLSVMELLAPVIIFSSLHLYLDRTRGAIVLISALLVSQYFVNFQRAPSNRDFVYQAPTILSEVPAGSMIVIDGYEPVAYAAMWLDDDIPMIRIRANFMNRNYDRHRLHQHALHRLRDHPGPRFLLAHASETQAPFVKDDLAEAGLALERVSECRQVFVSQELQAHMRLMLCPLSDMPAPGLPEYPEAGSQPLDQ